MGVTYKLALEIVNFILQNKQGNPGLSCRQLSQLIQEKFNLEVSKSSVNSLLKNAGLSMPVGRRRQKRKYTPSQPPKAEAPTELLKLAPPKVETPLPAPPKLEAPPMPIPLAEKPPEEPLKVEPPQPAPEPLFVAPQPQMPPAWENTGALLLKAADTLIGGSQAISTSIAATQALAESLIYLPLLEKGAAGTDKIIAFLNQLKERKSAGPAIATSLAGISEEIRCLKFSLQDNGVFYLDGQLHSVWSSPYLPYDFSTTLCDIRERLQRHLHEGMPLVLFMAPGYDAPTEEFFNFILSLSPLQKRISRLLLCGNKLEELQNLGTGKEENRPCVFGMWPWQFSSHRKVKSISEFKPYQHPVLKEEFFLADIELELSQPQTKRVLIFRGCALKKRNLNEKIKLLILENLPASHSGQEIADLYFCRWPNTEEAFQDYSRKIELFTYTANSAHFLSLENLFLQPQLAQTIELLFKEYLKALDLYVRWHFLPFGWEDKSFSEAEAEFYRLNCRLQKEEKQVLATFSPPESYPFRKDLAYACHRINEREVSLDGKRLFLEITQ